MSVMTTWMSARDSGLDAYLVCIQSTSWFTFKNLTCPGNIILIVIWTVLKWQCEHHNYANYNSQCKNVLTDIDMMVLLQFTRHKHLPKCYCNYHQEKNEF